MKYAQQIALNKYVKIIQENVSHAEKWENVHIHGERMKSVDAVHQEVQISYLLDRYSKSVILNAFKELKKTHV